MSLNFKSLDLRGVQCYLLEILLCHKPSLRLRDRHGHSETNSILAGLWDSSLRMGSRPLPVGTAVIDSDDRLSFVSAELSGSVSCGTALECNLNSAVAHDCNCHCGSAWPAARLCHTDRSVLNTVVFCDSDSSDI